MAPDEPPQEIVDLADARAAARRARDWTTADELKAAIEAAGWKVVDAASLYTLARAAPPTIEEAGVVRHGASVSVPSRLDESPVGTVTAVIVATGETAALHRTTRALLERSPDGTQVIVVANGIHPTAAPTLAEMDREDPGAPGVMTEVVWTTQPLGRAAALNAGIRRAVAPVVVLLEAGVVPEGDLLGAIAGALDDETVAVAGPVGLVSRDLRTFDRARADAADVDAIAMDAVGFRRADYVARGPLDEHFASAAYLDAWWSLVLRDVEDEDDGDADDDSSNDEADRAEAPAGPGLGARPRRAVRAGALAERADAASPGASTVGVDRDDRLARRNRYRFLKRFATRRDLVGRAAPLRDVPRSP